MKWIGEKSPDGRTYYWSRKSKETVWVLPPLEKKDSEEHFEVLSALVFSRVTFCTENRPQDETSP